MVRAIFGAYSMLFDALKLPSMHGWKRNKSLTIFLLAACIQPFGQKKKLTLLWCAGSNSM